jgi:uncharacterized protein YcfJ
MKKTILVVTLLAFLLVQLAGCASMNNTQQGAIGGAGAGALIGALVTKNSLLGALVGAGVGALIGAVAGNYLDKQTATRDQAMQKYTPEGEVRESSLTIEDANVAPTPVKQGDKVKSTVQYTILEPDASQLATIIETRSLVSGDSEVKKLSERNVTRDQGTCMSTFNFKVPKDIEPGDYTLVTTVSNGAQKQTARSPFTIKG